MASDEPSREEPQATDRPRIVNVRQSGRGHIIVGEGTTIINQPGNENEEETLSEASHNTFQPTNIGPGYCVTRGKVPFHTKKLWNPEPGRVITAAAKKDPKRSGRVGEFFKDVDTFLQSFSKLTADARDDQEQLLLQEILPLLEESCLKDDFRAIETYVILAKLSCKCTDSPTVIKHAQQLLLHLICKGNTKSCNAQIRRVEKILRGPLIQSNSVFTDAGPQQQMNRLTVYSRVLALMVIYMEQEYLLRETIADEDLKELGVVVDKLTRLAGATAYRKKGQLRYSAEFIQEAIGRILNKKKSCIRNEAFLDECERITNPNAEDFQEIGFLRRISQAKMNWFDLHLLLLYIHNQAIQNPKQAIKAIRRVQEAHLFKGSEFKKDVREDWKFFLLMSTILTDMAMTSGKKAIRTEAGYCMIQLLSIQEIKKTQASRMILEYHASRIVFSPDSITRKGVVYKLYWHDREHIPCHVLEEFLGWYHKNQALEFQNTKSQRKSDSSVIIAGVFRGREASVKILRPTTKEAADDNKVKERHQNFIIEAFNLRQLSPHANIPSLLAYDTERLPYHIITDLEARGNLLDVLRGMRDEESLSMSIDRLLQMCIDITAALLHLKRHNIVHRSVMARNVLVGKDFTCKLTSLDFARPLKPHEDTDGTYSYCSVDETHEFVSRDTEGIAVRWAAPECLQPPLHFSTASDVWALAVTMYEIFTFGCEPYARTRECRSLDCDQDVIDYVSKGGHPPKEVGFQESIFDLMESCWVMDRNKRPDLETITCKLQEIQEENMVSGKNAKPLSSPPPLKNATTTSNSFYPILFEPGVASGKFGELPVSLTSDHPMPASCWKRGPVAVESIVYRGNTQLQHLQELCKLDNDYLCKVLEISQSGSRIQVISAAPSMGNLKDYVMKIRCSNTDLIRYLSQVASAMEYLHHSNIVHGDLRAENIAVTSHMEVKVSRFGRSYRGSVPHLTEPDDLYSSTYDEPLYDLSPVYQTAKCPLYSDALRWSAPEVITDQHFSHASDVWAFGVLAWETFAAAATFGGGPGTAQIVPFMDIEDDQILSHLDQGARLPQPENCPPWLYCVMHQCWPYKRLQRPPFIAIADCLTSSEPMKSWMMKVWLIQHAEDSMILDLDVMQPEGAIHVRADELHPTGEKIRSMCSREFLSDHTYMYTRPYLDEDPYEEVLEQQDSTSHDVGGTSEAEYEEEYEDPSEHASGYEYSQCGKKWFHRKTKSRIPTRRRCRSTIQAYEVTILDKSSYKSLAAATSDSAYHHLETTKHDGYYVNTDGPQHKPIPAPRTKLHMFVNAGGNKEETDMQTDNLHCDLTVTASGDVRSESGEDEWKSEERMTNEEVVIYDEVVTHTDVSMIGSFTEIELYSPLPNESRKDMSENRGYHSTPVMPSSDLTTISEAQNGRKKEVDKKDGSVDQKVPPLDDLPRHLYENTIGSHIIKRRGGQEPTPDELTNDLLLEAEEEQTENGGLVKKFQGRPKTGNNDTVAEYDAQVETKRRKCADGRLAQYDRPTMFENQMYFCEKVLCFIPETPASKDLGPETQSFQELKECNDHSTELDCVPPGQDGRPSGVDQEDRDPLDILPNFFGPQNKSMKLPRTKPKIVLLAYL